MLWPADAQLAARDPALPGLGAALSAQAMQALIHHAGWEMKTAHLQGEYARYKPGTSCLVAYTGGAAGGGATHFYVVAHRHDAADKLAKAHQLARRDDSGAALVFPELGLAVYRFPLDRRLHRLPALTSSGACRRLLERLRIPLAGGRTPVTCTVLRYKPERRCVARMEQGERRWLVKLYADHGAFAAARAATRLQSGGPLRLADVTGWSRSGRALAWRWTPGRPLDEFCPAGSAIHAAYAAAGEALAELHSRQPRAAYRYDPATERTALLAAAQAITALAPEEAERIRLVLGNLLPRLAALPEEIALVHGDFSPDQVLIHGAEDGPAGDPVTLVDLDRLGVGHSAGDWGALQAWLHRAVLEGLYAPDQAEQCMAAFAAGYARRRALPDRAAVQLYAAMRLLRLAPEVFRRRRRPHWRVDLACTLQKTQEVLDVV